MTPLGDGPPQVRGSESELDINIRVALAAAGDTDTVVVNVRLTRNERKEGSTYRYG